MNTLQLLNMVSTATFRAMTKNDWHAFEGAAEGTVVAECGNYYMLKSPDGLFEIHNLATNACWQFKVERLN